MAVRIARRVAECVSEAEERPQHSCDRDCLSEECIRSSALQSSTRYRYPRGYSEEYRQVIPLAWGGYPQGSEASDAFLVEQRQPYPR